MEMLTNRINLAGRLISDVQFSHTVFDENFYSGTLEVKRLSGKADFIPMTFSERAVKENGVRENAFMRVEGQLRSYNYYMKLGEEYKNRRSKLIITGFCKCIYPFEGYVNDIMLDGYVCKKPVYRATPFGKQITDMLIAVNRNYGKSDYIPVIFWGNNALRACELDVGVHICVSGRLQSREYEKKNSYGEIRQHTTYEVSGFRLTVF